MVESKSVDSTAILAKTDRTVFDDLLRDYKPFIYSRVKRVAASPVTEQDDVSVIGINAFYEAVQAYAPGKGAFLPFAALVIQRRVTDYMRKNQGPPLLSLDMMREDDADGTVRLADKKAVELHERRTQEEALREEIAELSEELSQRGVSMDDVYKDSPRHRAGRDALQRAVSVILENEEYLNSLLNVNRLQIKKISENSKVPQKKLETSRRYILACVVIASGDYPLLKEYLYPEVKA